MNFVKVAWRDIRSILKNRFIRISVIAIILMPMLYSACFLGAFWDPYGRLDKLPIAIVNLDKGWTDDGKPVNYGKDFVTRMKDNHEMGWKFVGFEEAHKGLMGTKYYAEFIIPEDFSKKLLKSKTSKPETPVILFRCNEKKNFVISQFAGKAMPDKIKASITKTLAEKSVKVTFDSLYSLKDALQKAGDGSKKISDAVAGANDKLKDVKSKLDQNSAITDLITRENFSLLKNTLNDASSLKDVDTSMLKQVPQILTDKNISAIKKLNSDLKAANINNLLNDPAIKALPALATKENLKNINDLMKDTDTLAKIDMNKMKPLLDLMKNDDKISSIISDVKNLTSNIDMKKLQPLMKVMANKDQLLALVNGAEKLSTKIDATKLMPLVNLMQSSDKLFALLNDADKLQEFAVTKELTPIINLAKNSDKLAPILGDAQKLGSIDVTAIQKTLGDQVKGSQAFVEGTAFLPENKDSLKKSVMGNTSLTADQKKQLITVLEASSLVRDSMISSSKSIGALSQNLDVLKNAQTDVSSLLPLLKDVPQSIAYVNKEVIPAVTKLQDELGQSKSLMKNVPDSIAYVKGLTPELLSMYSKVQNVTPLMNGVPESLQYVNSLVPGALSLYTKFEAIKPLANNAMNSLDYVKTLAPKLLSMKSDLDKNELNLKAVKTLLAKVSDSKTKASLDKVMDLEKDVENLKPLITNLEGQMTDENLNKLKAVPGLVDKLVSMQKTLKDNEKVLDVAKDALTDENYEQASKLIDSIPSLLTQVQQLADGTKELSTKLNDGYKQLDKKLVNSSEDMGKFVAQPLQVTKKPINAVPNYGTGFAPYFIPLSIWIGALLMFLVMSLSVDPDIQAGPRSVVAGKYLSFGYIGVIQAVGVSFAVLALGLKPTNILMYVLFNIFLSFTFIAIIQALIFLLGFDPGKFLALVLLIIQLASSGGTFPTQLIPTIFAKINPFLPFTYATEGLRELISADPIDYSILSKDVFTLGGMMIGFLVISLLLKGHADKLQAKVESAKAEAFNNM